MNRVEIYANGQVVHQKGIAYFRVEDGDKPKEGYEPLENVTHVAAQMLAILHALDCTEADLDNMEYHLTAYTNLQFLERSWFKIKERGYVERQSNQELWERLFNHKLSKNLNIVWDKTKVEYVKDKAVKTLNNLIRKERNCNDQRDR